MTGAGGRTGWRQINLHFDDWRAAERAAATELLPLLDSTRHRIRVADWWFVRKGPVWRLRLWTPFDRQDGAPDVLTVLGADLAAAGSLRKWVEVIYEPEAHAFGGPAAMAVAHRLFSADSRHVLATLARGIADPDRRDHRRELGLLLATQLLRAAGQEWYEQGDVWQRLAAHRGPAAVPATVDPDLIEKVSRLLTATDDSRGSPLRAAPEWPAAFERCGATLAELAHGGTLTRGLRSVLTQHLLFTFNRLGVPAEQQYRLALAAGRAVFGEEPVSASTRNPQPDPTTEAERLRTNLADHIGSRGTFRTAAVEQAFRTVPRQLFLPGVDLADAYAPRPVVTKRADNGTALSSASSPNLVAGMLELLQVRPGHRVLEIGAATGINAALLAELTGPAGHVTTIELDEDLADGARRALDHTGHEAVEVVCGDGALGHDTGMPYDRIIVTAGAWDIPDAWWRQLAPHGRLVVPVRLHASGLTRVLPLVRRDVDHMVSTEAVVCGFVPMRGTDQQPEDVVRLTEEVVLAVDTSDSPDATALADALRHPPQRHWTGLRVRHDEPAEHLDLWLAFTPRKRGSFGRLSVSPNARAVGVDPAMRWAGASLYDRGSLAYLVARPHDDESNELGIVAHGPDAQNLTAVLDGLLQRWSGQRPTQPTVTASPTADTTPDPGYGTTVRPRTQLTVTW